MRQIADRDALGEQELQCREQRRLRDLRRAHVVEQALVLGLEPVHQRPHILIGQELGEVVVDDRSLLEKVLI
jgi:hypothetical protein